ncbi:MULTISPECIES: hypothetical protein [Halorussus]|uniref:hypothetical protein n=1 Tax=Halorussus TaxID=1070314 RepID=UPI0020A23400|nr:hypothetical protein [Halorussus vallis]USZ77530.1 hypothetical protein NGM07_09380 [Halorussus vallis]
MRLRIALVSLLVVSGIAPAGCAGTQSGTDTTSATTTTTTTTTTATTTTTTAEPEKGDNLLSITEISNSTAKKVNESKRANFSALNETQRDAFLKAYNCSCNLQQDVFEFNDKTRIEYVKYENRWYYLRVSIV